MLLLKVETLWHGPFLNAPDEGGTSMAPSLNIRPKVSVWGLCTLHTARTPSEAILAEPKAPP